MKHLINRAYARQRALSFQRTEERQRLEAGRYIFWAADWFLVVVALLLIWLFGD